MLPKYTWKQWVIVLAGVLAVGYVGRFVGRSLGNEMNRRSAAGVQQPAPDPAIQVVVSTQDSEGLTQGDFSSEFLSSLEAHTVERVKVRTAEFLASRGQPNVRVDIDSESMYIESGATKLAVIRLRGSGGGRSVFVAGVVGAELKRVACMRESEEPIPISYGVCADRINDVFGVDLAK